MPLVSHCRDRNGVATMNAQYVIKSACHFLLAQGKIPSARSVQAFLKTNIGSGVRHSVVLYYLDEFQREVEDDKDAEILL